MLAPKESLDSLKCGACNKYLSYFPIYVTENKSALCGRCSQFLSEGDKCVRDVPYESIAKFLKFPCIYKVEGCVENLTPSQVPMHEKNCAYRVIHCPVDCMWQGTVTDLLQHFEELHPTLILKNNEFEMDFLHSYEHYCLVVYNDELFSFKRKFDNSKKVLECSFFCYKAVDVLTQYNYEIIVKSGSSRNGEIKFPPKSAENFHIENTTKIVVKEVMTELKDPSIIIGEFRISNAKEELPISPSKVHHPDINYDMLSELECPVCFDYIIPPIFQCVTGHSICSDCKDKVSECPTCKGDVKNIHNFTLEKMAHFLTYPCKYADYGCNFTAKPANMKSHQQFCLHGPHECPLKEYENCKWKNSTNKIFPHVLETHHDNVLEINLINLFVGGDYFDDEDEIGYVIKYSDLLFILHYRYKQKTFYWAVQLIGPPEESVKYKFEIDILDNTENNQKMFFRKSCGPLANKSACFQQVEYYAFIKLNQIKSFFTDIFSYTIQITK